MATHIYTAPLSHTSDAGFRAWGLALSTGLDTVGFPKVDPLIEPNQIDWATVLRPGINTVAGYEIRYLNDSFHGTRPLYVKIEFGTANSISTNPSLWITIGSGTNGVGAITGTLFARKTFNMTTGSGTPTAGSFATYLCVRDGYLMICHQLLGLGAGTTANLNFVLMRMSNTAGNYTDQGVHWYYGTSVGNVVRASNVWSGEIYDGYNYSLFPGGNTSTFFNAEAQVMRHFTYAPQLIGVVPDVLSYIDVEIPGASLFTATPVGETQRTYLALGAGSNADNASAAALAEHRLAVRFE